eukprot:4433384-Amphidinium_carterae.1
MEETCANGHGDQRFNLGVNSPVAGRIQEDLYVAIHHQKSQGWHNTLHKMSNNFHNPRLASLRIQ